MQTPLRASEKSLNQMNKLLFLLATIVLLISCNRNKIYIDNFHNKYDQIEIDSFEIYATYGNVQNVTFEMEWLSGNRREHLNFFGLKKDFNKHKKGEVVFLSLIRKTFLDSITCEVGYNEKRDTLYVLYRKNKNDSIIQGAYYYKYKYDYSSLSKEQRLFFENNNDSIIKNRINSIPNFND